MTPLWVLYPSEIKHIGSTRPLLARAVFTKSIKVLGWQAGAPKSREHDFAKKNVIFLNFIGPVTPPWVLYPSEIMQMGFTELLRARAVFAKSIKVLAWQPGALKSRSTTFRKKTSFFLKFIGPVTPPWFLYPSEIMHMGFKERLLAKAVFIKSIKVLYGNEEPRKPGSRIFQKKRPDFLKFIGPVTPLLVLYPSEIMHVVFTGPLLARAVFARSIKVHGLQPGVPKSREHDFPKKKNVFFLNFIGPVTPPWVLYPSEIMHLGSTEILLTRAVFTGSIKVPGWQPGAPKPRGLGFPEKKNVLIFLKFIGPVTPLLVLYPSEIMHMGFTEHLRARAVFAKSIKVLAWQPGAPKSREHDFPKKKTSFF